MTHPATPLAYQPALNGLRAVAVGIVLVQHWLQPAFPLGELGPSLFFVLSGYLVSGIIWQYGAYVGAPGKWWQRVRTFYLRRALRIVPAYYLVLLGCALLPLVTVREHAGWFLLPGANLLMYRLCGWGDGVGHFWTIAVEVQFYLLWPVVLGLLGRRLKPLLGLVAAGWLFRVLWSVGVRADMIHLLLPASLDLFALGAVLHLNPAWLARLAQGRYVGLAWLGWVAWRLVAADAAWAAPQAIWLAGADFLTIGWLLRAPETGRRLGLCHPVAQWLGDRSYGMYLYHLPLLVLGQRVVYHFIPQATERTAWMGPLPVALILLPALLLLSAASWRFVEAPINQAKKWFRYPDSPAVVPKAETKKR